MALSKDQALEALCEIWWTEQLQCGLFECSESWRETDELTRDTFRVMIERVTRHGANVIRAVLPEPHSLAA